MFFCVDQAGCNPETPADDVQIMHYLPMATFGEEFSKGVAPRVRQQLVNRGANHVSCVRGRLKAVK